jgi:hypothetical protein
MAYIINRFSGQQLVVLEDGTLNTTTSIGLVGRNYTGYGEIQNENFLFLLENFANQNPPARPLSGQTWFNTVTDTLNIYNGVGWNAVGSAVVDNIEPNAAPGALWLDSATNQLYTYNDGWNLIGPEAVNNFGVTKLKGRSVRDADSVDHAILELVVDDKPLAVISSDEFFLSLDTPIQGFTNISKGINLSSFREVSGQTVNLIGNVVGNATTATRLQNTRTINGINFDGQTDITIRSSTTASLTPGAYVLGSVFDGSDPRTWTINATPNNTVGTVVARDSGGDFSAGTITADTVGTHIGQVTAPTGTSTFDVIQARSIVGATLSGNSFTATRLETTRTINTVPFNGTENITVTADASTLTGTRINSTVVGSNLQSTGILNNLKIKDAGLVVGDNNGLKIYTTSDFEIPTISSQTVGKPLNFEIVDSTISGGVVNVRLIASAQSLDLGGPLTPAFIPTENLVTNLGIPTSRWKNVYSERFIGLATTAAYADLAENYVADAAYEFGTVLEFGGEYEVTLGTDETTRVAGVVSQNPAYLMNSDCTGKYVTPIALQGRVPCRVKGTVRKGDMLVSAGTGVAKACQTPQMGSVIGKALEDFNGNEGIIEVVVGRL